MSPQAFNIDSYNSATNISVPSLAFSTSNVRAAFIRYTVYRNTSLTTMVEGGTMTIVYNPAGPTGFKWQMDRKYLGDAAIDFIVTDTGQIQFTTSPLSGTSHTGIITFSAQALLQSY